MIYLIHYDSLVKEVLHSVPIRYPNETIHDLPPVYQEHRGYIRHFETISYLSQFVNVDLNKLESAIIGLCDLFECRSQGLARPTPTIEISKFMLITLHSNLR